MRIGIAALLGAIVIFFWQFASHMVLPVGQMGFRLPTNEDVVLQAVSSGLPQPGVYLLPSIDPAKMSDEAVRSAWIEKQKKNPFAFVVIAPPEQSAGGMGAQLGMQFVINLIGALIIAWLLAATAWGFGARVLGATALGVFGWLVNTLPQWNWYRFPVDFALGNLIDQGVGWLLAGVAIAWWLGRAQRSY
jgi:hypothetical protein